MKIFFIGILIILTVLAFTISYSSDDITNYKFNGSLELVDNAYRDGEITQGQKIFLNLQCLFDAEGLPDEFRSEAVTVIRSGTPLFNEAIDNWHLLTSEQQNMASAWLARPPLDSAYMSPEGHFMVHYCFVYPDSVSDEDLNFNEVPDYVERIGLYADSSYHYYHDNLDNNLNYLTPPSDSDGIYDIYLVGMGPAYGGTSRELPGDSAWNDYQSHIKINCTFNFVAENDDPEGKIIGAQKVTCAHEYYHAVQLAYAYLNCADIWWVEGGASFFEDAVYEEVNDNYIYLKYFFNNADSFLIDTGCYQTLHDYGTWVFSAFLSEKYGFNSIKSVWENLRYYDFLPSLDSGLANYNQTLKTVFPEFTLWNYFTGDRADTVFYDDGADYLQIDTILQVIPSCPFSGVTPDYPPDGLSANYLITYPDTSVSGLLSIQFDGDNSVEWGFSVAVFKDDSVEVVTNIEVNAQGKTYYGIYDFAKYDSILFVPSVVSRWHNNNWYTFDTDIYPFGDVDGNGNLNLLDVTYLINFLYKEGIEPKHNVLMGDANCSGVVNILDVSYLISLLYYGGPPTCGYRF